jgi:SAM-dependent methyltransferase
MTIAAKAAAYYDRLGDNYISERQSTHLQRYHRRRFDSAKALLTGVVQGGSLYDFGCGTGELFSELGNAFAYHGCDISPEMIRLCGDRTGVVCAVGGIEHFESRPGPFDAVVVLNTLPYLTEDDERRFYQHAAKALRPGGALLISHTNMLFDLVSFNRYTVEFYRDVVCPAAAIDPSAADHIASGLLKQGDYPPADPATMNAGPATQISDRDKVAKRRVDPFEYPRQVEAFGFKLGKLTPLNCYALPPLVTHLPALALEQAQHLWAERLPPTLAKILSTQFQAVFVRS